MTSLQALAAAVDQRLPNLRRSQQHTVAYGKRSQGRIDELNSTLLPCTQRVEEQAGAHLLLLRASCVLMRAAALLVGQLPGGQERLSSVLAQAGRRQRLLVARTSLARLLPRAKASAGYLLH